MKIKLTLLQLFQIDRVEISACQSIKTAIRFQVLTNSNQLFFLVSSKYKTFCNKKNYVFQSLVVATGEKSFTALFYRKKKLQSLILLMITVINESYDFSVRFEKSKGGKKIEKNIFYHC